MTNFIKMDYKNITLGILLLIFPVLLMAQNGYDEQVIQEKPFSESRWNKLKKNLDYSDNGLAKKKKEKDANLENEGRRGRQQDNLPSGGAMFQGSKTLKIVFFTIAILALALVIWKLVQAQMKLKNPKVKQQIADLEEAVENIQESDLERFLREALEGNNYKLAIRVYYLMIIKALADKKLIKWKKDKTNNAYVREMKKTEYYNRFKTITRQFERTWFGENEITKQDFQKLQPEFSGFVNTIK